MVHYGRVAAATDHAGRRVWVLQGAPHIHQRAKRVFPRIDASQMGRLTLWDTPDVCRDLAWFLERYPLEMAPADRAALDAGAAAHREQIATLESLIDPAYAPPPVALTKPLRDYQTREVHIFWQVGGVLIGDDVGLGKTVAAIGSLTDARLLPAVVVTYTHLTGQWAAMIQDYAPGLIVHVTAKSRPYELPKFFGRGPDVVVTTYHKLAPWGDVFHAYAKSLILDEVQELRHPGTAKYTAAQYIGEAAPFRLGLSATPIYNYGREIYYVLNVLRPGVLGDIHEFEREWCDRGGKIRDPKAFGSWAREQFLMIRHTRKDVKRELPAVQRVVHTVEADTAALDRVKDAASELAHIILAGAGLTEKGAKFRAAEEFSNLLRQATGIAKAPYVAEFVKLLLESGEQVVLCGWHRAVYDIWQSRLKDYHPALYTGSETAAQKAAAAARFIAGESRLLILSLRSGAGLNGLERAASVIVFGELDWSPGAIEQCIGRLNRDGQDTPVLAYFLVSEDGADPIMAETLGIKREQVEGINNPTEDFLEELQVDGSHARRLAEDFLARRRAGRPLQLITPRTVGEGRGFETRHPATQEDQCSE